MNSSLIKIGKSEISGQPKETVNARELHQFIESKSKFSDWIKNRIEKYGFLEKEDYLSLSKNLENGGRIIEYFITLDMAKELSMIENNDKGRQIRRYFIQCEKQIYSPVKQIEPVKPKALNYPDNRVVVKKVNANNMSPTYEIDDKVLCVLTNRITEYNQAYLLRCNEFYYIRRAVKTSDDRILLINDNRSDRRYDGFLKKNDEIMAMIIQKCN